MGRWSLPLFVMAVFAGLFGFVGVGDYSWAGAQVLCFVFLILAVLSFLGEVLKWTPPWPWRGAARLPVTTSFPRDSARARPQADTQSGTAPGGPS